jgi:uncharacterized protein (DUF849 family)
VRIGFESNRLLPDGSMAKNNVQLTIEELKLVAKSAAAQRPIASAGWVRSNLV